MEVILHDWLEDRRLRFAECERLDASIEHDGANLKVIASFAPRYDGIGRTLMEAIGPSSMSTQEAENHLRRALEALEHEILAIIRP
jgi:hypothetical protein